MPIKTLAQSVVLVAILIHLWSISRSFGAGSDTLLSLNGAVAVETLAAGSLLVFLGIRLISPDERRVASVSIFTASLVLSLTAPALFLPVAAERAEWWALLGGPALEVKSAIGSFSLWALSLLLGGLAMHLSVSLRWQRVSRPA